MTKYALVKNGQVTNVVTWDGQSDWTPPQGVDLVPVGADVTVEPGWTLASKGAAKFNPPEGVPVKPAKPVEAPTPDVLLAALEAAETVEDLKAALVGYYSSIVAARAASFELRDARKAAQA